MVLSLCFWHIYLILSHASDVNFIIGTKYNTIRHNNRYVIWIGYVTFTYIFISDEELSGCNMAPRILGTILSDVYLLAWFEMVVQNWYVVYSFRFPCVYSCAYTLHCFYVWISYFAYLLSNYSKSDVQIACCIKYL